MKSAAIYLCDSVTKEMTLVNLFEESATIGSGEGAHIRLTDLRCSGIHAYIEEKGDKFLLVDLGGKTGTFVNGKKIEEAFIKSGESFLIGNSELVIKNIPKALAGSMGSLQVVNAGENIENLDLKENAKRLDELTLVTDRNLLQVSLYWGQQLLEVRTFEPGSNISIGSRKNSTFGVTLLTTDFYDLATYKNQEVELTIPSEINGILWMGNDTYPLDKLRERQKESDNLKIVLRIGDRIDLQIGELILSFKFVLPSEKISRFVIPKLDKRLARILGILFAIYLFIFILLSIDIKFEDKKEKVLPKELQKVLFKTGVKWAKKEQQSALGEMISKEGGRAKGAEGQATVRRAEEKSKKTESAVKEKLQETKDAKREMVKEIEKDVDVNSAFDKTKTKSVVEDVSVEGPKQEGNTIGALTGGHFARGTSGLGEGGGGESVGIGQVKGLSVGGGEGAGDYGVERSKGREIDVASVEEVVMLDGLDPEIIAAVIKRYLPQIQHCYESELIKVPDLKGKVVVNFEIIGDGSTRNGKIIETGLRNKNVENCIIEKIKKWQFPKPKGGGSVNVKYPFLLMSTSSNE